MKKYIFIGIAALTLTSCNDFLDKEPLDFGSEEAYYRTENDLRIAANAFYTILPQNNSSQHAGSSMNNGLYTDDIESDNQFGTGAQNLLYQGNKFMPDANSSQWNFDNLRGINFFIQKADENYDIITGSQTYIDHYIGEAYFFRAFEHFKLLRKYGDIPIVKHMVTDDNADLLESTKRWPRNEAARFIISDLDKAADMMMEAAPETGRVTKGAALALKSRVALFEATWEKYHAGTCFVPGNDKWPGKAYWPNFTWEAGSAEAEINWFLDQAIDASEKAVALHPLSDDYLGMFNSIDVSGFTEVILARYYNQSNLNHNCSRYLKSGGGCGVTHQAVYTYLMKNGLPVYASNSGYHGDETTYLELLDRDPRLAGNRNADGTYPQNENATNFGKNNASVTQKNSWYNGYGVIRAAGDIKDENNEQVFYYHPAITGSGQERATTGYELNKWYSTDPNMQTSNSYTAVPIFRSAECMLNYLEAYYERYGSLGGKCDEYWKALRSRAGMDTDYQKTISNTDLTKEQDLGVYSKGKMVDVTLYNIRRERRCELMAEGRRTDDLKRWRSFDSMVNWQPLGFNLYSSDQMTSLYLSGNATEISSVSTKADGDYLMPLKQAGNTNARDGYNFPKPHYLEPIPLSEFTLTKDPATGESVLYQNPGWSSTQAGTADYSYNCD